MTHSLSLSLKLFALLFSPPPLPLLAESDTEVHQSRCPVGDKTVTALCVGSEVDRLLFCYKQTQNRSISPMRNPPCRVRPSVGCQMPANAFLILLALAGADQRAHWTEAACMDFIGYHVAQTLRGGNRYIHLHRSPCDRIRNQCIRVHPKVHGRASVMYTILHEGCPFSSHT